jgi:hypothetical protein
MTTATLDDGLLRLSTLGHPSITPSIQRRRLAEDSRPNASRR